jgi:glycosyltransferase involved in cell wall biosynthesis
VLVLDPPPAPPPTPREVQPPASASEPAPRPPRIAVFTDTIADINGVARFVHALAHCAPEHIHVLSSTRLGPPALANIHIARPFLTRPMPGYPTLHLVLPSAPELIRLADAIAPDAVHVSTPGPIGWVGRWYALKRGLPLIGTFHTDFPAYIAQLFDDPILCRASEFVLRRFYSPFNLALARSPASLSTLAQIGISSNRVACLPPGIDTDTFHPRFRDDAGSIWSSVPHARPRSTKVLYVGRLSVEKNLPMLTRMWPQVRAKCQEQRIDAQIIIIGDGPYRPQMQRDLEHHDACFAGFRHGSDLSTLYASSDLFVFPSTTDTLGQAVMEAQASGLPAIVTTEGGPVYIVKHNHTGLICAPNNTDHWTSAILSLIADPARRAAMSHAARTHVAPMTIAASIQSFLDLHAGALQKHKPGRALARGPARR